MDSLCLWISNRRKLNTMSLCQLANRRCVIINIFGGISDFIKKSSLATIEQITNKAIKNTNYRDIVSIDTFKTLLCTILKHPSNLSWIQHQKLYNTLNNASFVTLEQRTKIKNVQINVHYLQSPICRISNDLLTEILSFSEFHEYCLMKNVCISWMFCICSLAESEHQYSSINMGHILNEWRKNKNMMLCSPSSKMENALHVVQNQFMQNPMSDWRKKLFVNSNVLILDRSYNLVTGTVIDVDEYTKYIHISIEGENEWISRYSSRVQCVASVNPNDYIKAITIISNIIIPWMSAQKTPISNIIQRKITLILNHLHILEKRQSEYMFNEECNMNRGYLVYLLDTLHERISIPPNTYFLCVCMVNFMLKYYNKKHINMDDDALVCSLLKASAIQTNQLQILNMVDEHVLRYELDITEINKIDAHLNKLMSKYEIYTLVTPFTFASIYAQTILSKISSNSSESSTKTWKETRKLIVKQMKRMVSDAKKFSMYPSEIAKTSIYAASAKVYPKYQK